MFLSLVVLWLLNSSLLCAGFLYMLSYPAYTPPPHRITLAPRTHSQHSVLPTTLFYEDSCHVSIEDYFWFKAKLLGTVVLSFWGVMMGDLSGQPDKTQWNIH